MQRNHSETRLSVRNDLTDNQHNPLLSRAEQAHIDAVRARWAGYQESGHPAPRLKALIALMARANLYKLGTNALALAFVAFYAVDFVNVAANGNHIYTIYRLFPVLASTAIAVAIETLPENSLVRLFYLAGMFTVSWLV